MRRTLLVGVALLLAACTEPMQPQPAPERFSAPTEVKQYLVGNNYVCSLPVQIDTLHTTWQGMDYLVPSAAGTLVVHLRVGELMIAARTGHFDAVNRQPLTQPELKLMYDGGVIDHKWTCTLGDGK